MKSSSEKTATLIKLNFFINLHKLLQSQRKISMQTVSWGVLENLCQSDIINIIRIDIDGREKTI